MFRLALANLLQNRTRLVISVAGVGLALALVLFFGAVFAGAQDRLTVYIDRAGADIWVSQQGVSTMHMSESALPATVVDDVRSVPGVEVAVPILYTEGMIEANGKDYIAYVFGVPPNAPLGGPTSLVEGRPVGGPGELVIDRAIASQSGLHVGDKAMVLGQELTVVGLTSGTSSLVSSPSFIWMEDFSRVRGGGAVISFVLVKVTAGESAQAMVSRIGEEVDGVTVQTRQEFAAQERRLVDDMSSDIIGIMNTAGYLTGLAVIVLTIYIATVARRREYGVLKAIGVRNGRLFQIVLLQAMATVVMGFVVALGLTVGLSLLIPRFNELIVLSISPRSLLDVALISMLLAGVAALLPARQLAGLEPVEILRRG